MTQLNVYRIGPEVKVGAIDISFTNASLFMIISSVAILLIFNLGSKKNSLLPNKIQLLAELSYTFVSKMISDTAGSKAKPYFAFIFSLFMFVLFCNMFGMIPYTFTVTSHIIVTFTLAMMVMSLVIGYGVFKNGFRFLKLFWPSGIPMAILPFVSILEIISFVSRPISLSVRLWANMFAGHILLKLFAGFSIMMITGLGFFPGALGAIIPYAMTLALTPLEFLVAFVQAYVFALLTCVYLSDALHPGHH